MVSIEVNFLTGRFVATAHHDRTSPEWPPHPARLFSALVATWADTDQPDPIEKQAIEWLESLPPPSIRASDATPRTAVTHFVPVNDARIVSQSSYNKRAGRVEHLIAEIHDAQAEGAPERTQRILHARLRRQRDVSGIVASAGNTPVSAAVDIMPPGWVSTSGDVRTGQSRMYPSVTPTEPRVTYVWDTDAVGDTTVVLDGLCARLTRLGHSSSLVSCRLVQDHPTPNHVPGEGSEILRSVRSGQLATLEREHKKHQASRPRTLPFAPVRYREVEPKIVDDDAAAKADTAGEWLVLAFRRGSKRFPSTLTVEVATALRGAVFHHAADPIPEGLSGHRPGGRPSTNPHVAFLPLPWVGEHADGRLMGAAVAMPEQLDGASRRALLRAVGAWEEIQDPMTLNLGRRGRLQMDRTTGPSPLVTLRRPVWRRAVRHWVSAVPIALPTHPGRLSSGSAAARGKAWARAEQAVINSCLHVGLPPPVDVAVSLAPLISGARPAPAFPPFRQPGSGGRPIARRLVHAAVTFEKPIIGPLVLGAGRYLGLGLMRPMTERRLSDG